MYQFSAALTPSLSVRGTPSSAFLGGETTLGSPGFQWGIFGCIAFLVPLCVYFHGYVSIANHLACYFRHTLQLQNQVPIFS